MPKSTSIPAQPLISFINGGLREYIFDLAYDALDSLEAAIIRLRNLEVFVLDIKENPEIKRTSGIMDIKNTAHHMKQFQGVEQMVDEALFSRKCYDDASLMDVNEFDYHIFIVGDRVEAHITRLEGYIVSALGKLPDEIPSGKIRTQLDVLNQELANLYGSSELPSLAASFESKSKDEVFEQAKGVLKTLQTLLDQAKSLALEHMLLRKSHFHDLGAGGLGELLDRAHHMCLLQHYIEAHRYKGQAITKFMAGKFDRSAARLDCLLRAYILYYEYIPKVVTPVDMPSLSAACKGMCLWSMETQNWEDNIALKSLRRKHHDVRARTPLMAAAHDLEDRADIGGIETRRLMARSLRKRVSDGCCCVLGTDFTKSVFWIFHCLIRADMETFEKLISDVEMLRSQ